MLMILAAALVLGYGLLSSWAYRRGGVALLLAALITLHVIVGLTALYGLRVGVPSLSRLLFFASATAGPAVLLPTGLLWLLRRNPNPTLTPLPLALVSGALGLFLGYMAALFLLGA